MHLAFDLPLTPRMFQRCPNRRFIVLEIPCKLTHFTHPTRMSVYHPTVKAGPKTFTKHVREPFTHLKQILELSMQPTHLIHCHDILRGAVGGADVEVILGIHSDLQFGPVIALGAGGVLVELVDDLILRLPPLTRHEAAAMLRQTRVWRLLQGFRNHPPADVMALEQLLVNISRLICEQADRIVTLDLNPVLVLPLGHGVRVADARLVARAAAEHGSGFTQMPPGEGTL